MQEVVRLTLSHGLDESTNRRSVPTLILPPGSLFIVDAWI